MPDAQANLIAFVPGAKKILLRDGQPAKCSLLGVRGVEDAIDMLECIHEESHGWTKSRDGDFQTDLAKLVGRENSSLHALYSTHGVRVWCNPGAEEWFAEIEEICKRCCAPSYEAPDFAVLGTWAQTGSAVRRRGLITLGPVVAKPTKNEALANEASSKVRQCAGSAFSRPRPASFRSTGRGHRVSQISPLAI